VFFKNNHTIRAGATPLSIGKEARGMKKLKAYTKAFVKDENGSELVQWAVIIAIAVVLAAIAVAISNSAGEKLNDAKDFIDDLPIPQSGS